MPARVKPVVRWSIGHAIPRSAVRIAARRGDLQARLIDDSDRMPTAALNDLFNEIRGRGRLHKAKFAYLTANHGVVKELLTSNDFRGGVGAGDDSLLNRLFRWSAADYLHPASPPSLLVTEPPDHTRYRKLVTRVFTVRAVENLRRRTEQIAQELLDAIDPAQPVDLAETYCSLLPVTVIAEILGVPPEQRHHVLELGAAAAPSLDVGLSWRQFRTVDAALEAFDRWLGEHLDQLKANPGDNLLSQLVAAREDGVGLNDLELKATAGLVLAAGFETTVNLLGNGVALLHNNPGELAALRQDPALWPNAVDEVLRIDPPVLLTGRTAVRDTQVAGTRVPNGAIVVGILAAANRDPDLFDDPVRFDVSRPNAREHVSFSAGRHYCLGAALARMEGEVGLRALFDRYPNLQLKAGARRRGTRILRGYERLPAVLG
ncbi:cytochrome P450 [Kibdelosporangium philippinense]|uniref:Cytochrome P450 n=1 Tax=Kibdelosporangium philippinense TaxID=211113 RepID=A0ABS8Z6Z0_9PSEU|nr:cytochrome P450 [Kibdelosporangium philippinense]MCE7003257.1 cytochrome P450 [Kibdelosporangium philippinense]